jgi:acyl carrier protein
MGSILTIKDHTMSQQVNEALFKRLKEIVVDKLEVKEVDVVMDATFRDDLGADSLAIVELIMNIEDHFGITISDEDAETLTTVGKAMMYVQSKLEEGEVA